MEDIEKLARVMDVYAKMYEGLAVQGMKDNPYNFIPCSVVTDHETAQNFKRVSNYLREMRPLLDQATLPVLNTKHVDGPYFSWSDGKTRFLTVGERIKMFLGRLDMEKVQP